MAYKKPQIVAKSEPKQIYVAGCPEIRPVFPYCTRENEYCMCGYLN